MGNNIVYELGDLSVVVAANGITIHTLHDTILIDHGDFADLWILMQRVKALKDDAAALASPPVDAGEGRTNATHQAT